MNRVPTPPDAEPGSQPVENATHEAWCIEVAVEGYAYNQAYRRIISAACAPNTAWTNGSMLATKYALRLDYLRRTRAKTIMEALGITAISVARHHLAVLDTPVGDLEADSPLAQEVTKRRMVTEAGEEWETLKIKMPGKGEAARALADLCGFNAALKQDTTIRHDATTDDLLGSPAALHALGLALRGNETGMRAITEGMEGRPMS